MVKPSYPIEILPHPGWTQTINVRDILRICPSAMLGRQLAGNFKDCIDDSVGEGMEFIRKDALPLERMANLSCSLLGTYFTLPCFHFLPDNDGKEPWKEGMEVNKELLSEQNYNYFPDIVVVGWTLQALENMTLPYQRKFAKESDFDAFQKSAVAVAAERNIEIVKHEWADLMEDENNRNLRIAEYEGEIRDNHAPTMLNYWHFTIDLYPANDSEHPLKKVSKGWSMVMAISLQDYLCHTYVLLTDDAQATRITDGCIWEKTKKIS